MDIDKDYFNEDKFVKKTIDIEAEKEQHAGQDKMHICFNVDKNYFDQLGVMATSILETNRDLDLEFHVFINEIAEDDLEKVRQLVKKYEQAFHIYLMNMEPFSKFHLLHQRYSHVGYFRIYMPKILKRYTDRFLYIDADMVCLGSLRPFLEIDFDGTPFAAVSDVADAVKTRLDFLKLKNDKYFNAGMMWINVEEWEKQQITERCFEYTGKDPKMFMGHDQDVLNLALDGNFVLLPNKFNFLGGMGSSGPEDTIFYHFFGRTKPWEICLNEFDELWWQANDLSLWRHARIKYPPLQPRYYHDYKYAGKYYSKKKEHLKAWKCYLIYSYLKMRYKL